MTERSSRLTLIGLVVLLVGLGLYGLAILLAGAAAVTAAAAQIWPVFIILGPIALGAVLILIGVVRDRLTNAEDEHYARNVDQ